MWHFPGSTLRELSRSGRAAIPDPLGTQGRGPRLLLRGTGLVLELRLFVAGPPPFPGPVRRSRGDWEMTRQSFQMRRGGSWTVGEDPASQGRFLPRLRDLGPNDRGIGIRIGLDEVLPLLTVPGSRKTAVLREICGDGLTSVITGTALGRLNALTLRLAELRRGDPDAALVTPGEYQEALASQEDDRQTEIETEKILGDFDLLLEGEDRLERSLKDLDSARETLRRAEALKKSSQEDENTLRIYERIMKGCQIHIEQIQNGRKTLQHLRDDVAELRRRRELMSQEHEDKERRAASARKKVDYLQAARVGREQIIVSAQRMEGSITVLTNRMHTLQAEFDGRDAEFREARDRVTALRERRTRLDGRIGQLSEYLETRSDLASCCLDFEKVADTMTRYIATDARIAMGQEDLRSMLGPLEEKRRLLEEAEDLLRQAEEKRDGIRQSLDAVEDARDSADEIRADSRLDAVVDRIEFLRSLLPGIGRCTEVFRLLTDAEAACGETERRRREAAEDLMRHRESMAADASRLQTVHQRLEEITDYESLAAFREKMRNGCRCPLCGGTVAGLDEFAAELAGEKTSLEESAASLEARIREGAGTQAALERDLEDLEREKEELLSRKFSLRGEADTFCRDLMASTGDRSMELQLENGRGEFTADSFAAAANQIRLILETGEREFEELLHVKGRSDRTFHSCVLLRSELARAEVNLGGCLRRRDECLADYRGCQDERADLERELEECRSQLAELDSTLSGTMGDTWTRLCNGFMREERTIPEKEEAISSWKNECRKYLDCQEERKISLEQQESLDSEIAVAEKYLARCESRRSDRARELADTKEELGEVADGRRRILDDSVAGAMNALNDDVESASGELTRISTEAGRLAGSLEIADRTLAQLGKQIAEEEEDVRSAEEAVNAFLEVNHDITRDMLEEMLEHDGSFYELLRSSLEEIDQDVITARQSCAAAEEEVQISRREYDMRLGNIPEVNRSAVTDGLLSREWIERRRGERLRMSAAARERRELVARYEEQIRRRRLQEEEAGELGEIVSLIRGEADIPDPVDEQGFSRIGGNAVLKMMADHASAMLYRAGAPCRLAAVPDPSRPGFLTLDIVDQRRGGSATGIHTLKKGEQFSLSLAAFAGLLDLTGESGDDQMGPVGVLYVEDGGLAGGASSPAPAFRILEAAAGARDVVLLTSDGGLAGEGNRLVAAAVADAGEVTAADPAL